MVSVVGPAGIGTGYVVPAGTGVIDGSDSRATRRYGSATMYRFLLRPRWILSHIAVLALIVAMVNLSLWQVRRLDERRELNALIAARGDGEPVDLERALRGIDAPDDGERVDYQIVKVRGTFDAEHEFTVPSRTLNGAPGRYVVTPLRPESGGAEVLVFRGFIPQAIADTDPPIDGVEPPSGTATVVGWLRVTERPGSLQRDDADLGNHQFARIDIAGIERSTGRAYAPVYVQADRITPASDAPLLSPFPLPERTEGPHFSYAAQWAIFTLIALFGYPMVLRRVARSRDDDDDDDDDAITDGGHGS